MVQLHNRPATPKQAVSRRERIDEQLDPLLFKALSDPTRLALFACIAKCGRGCTVSEVAESFSVDLSVVSRHLSLLAQAGVLESTKEGRMVRYTARYAHLSTALRAVADSLTDCCPGGCDGDCGCGCGC